MATKLQIYSEQWTCKIVWTTVHWVKKSLSTTNRITSITFIVGGCDVYSSKELKLWVGFIVFSIPLMVSLCSIKKTTFQDVTLD